MLRRSARALPVVVAMAVVAIGAMIGFAPAASPSAPSKVTVRTVDPGRPSLAGTWKATAPGSPTSYLVADAVPAQVHLYSAPDVPYGPRPVMDNPTWEGLPVVFLVLAEQGPWLQVRVSLRPNGLVGWVLRSEVVLREVPNHVLIQLGARTVTVLHGDHVVLTAPVAIGAPGSPTPTGNFFVDGIVQVPNPDGVYGAYQVSVSGFSDVYQQFGEGNGQIAMHGTNRPDQVASGEAISHGCVRMTNDVITMMSELAPLGTPVDIVA